ncbi:hypothetical protein BOX15_Mlig017759g1 [Macrostomum lignano]|uniref:Structural maintenance of chromosomes protein n=1 Tax=Macrostomum lignano TaxID=282301 RepID=A0A267H527_9PLAT|nr:hypothetical protein BOX15_Mlig017759g1 [Macrostomum lignano]
MVGRLQRIEIENFKSYKGFQIIGPFKDFTSVIGPNGSGKSNLMDALSFVLGDQTRHLRVKKLSELIHGAVVERPVAKSAFVAVVYESEDKQETRFSRHIHGNTSEYKINNSTVRAEEYSAALEKIQIFMKGKNFLVFQGAVEAIALKNPKERCQMLEELSKSIELKEEYDNAKAEMEQAELETQTTYNKKKGMVAERKEAKMEKEEAEKFKRLKQEYSAKQMDLMQFKLYYNEQEIRTVKGELESKEKNLQKEHAARAEIEEEMKAKKKEQAKLQREAGQLEQEIKKAEFKINKKKPDHIRCKERMRHLQDKCNDCKKSLENARLANTAHVQETSHLEAELRKVQSLRDDWEQRQSQQYVSQGKDLQLADSQVQEYNRLKQQVAIETAGIQARLDDHEREYREDKDSYDAMVRHKNDIVSSYKRKETELSENQKRLSKLEEYISSSRQQIHELRQLAERLTEEINTANERLEKLQQELAEIDRQLGDASVERTESSRAQRKRELIENLKRLFPSVSGRLLEMCEPSHRKYQVAITKVLGKYMDAIVVDSESTAKDCITYMKEQRLEPETFLPLDYLDVAPIDEKLRGIKSPENVHLVIDVIHFDPPTIKKALQFACGNALVCETVEDARYVAYKTGGRKKTVSLDGTLFQKSGVISGGASELRARARRWDEKQVANLKNKKEKLQAELKDLMKIKRKEAELKNVQSSIQGLETRLKYTEKDRDTTEQKLKQSNEADLTDMGGELNKIDGEAAKLQIRMQQIHNLIEAEREKLNGVEDTVFRDFCAQIGVDNIRLYEERELRVAQDRDKRRMEYQQQIQKLTNQLEYERSRDTEAAIRRWEELLQEERGQMESLRAEEQKLKEQIEQEEAKKKTSESKLKTSRSQLEKLEEEFGEVRRRLGLKQKEITRCQKELTQCESRLETKRSQRHSLLRQAKMDGLELPLRQGSMDDIEDEYDEENVQAESQTIYAKEEGIVIDFRGLDKSLRKFEDPKVIQSKADSLRKEVDTLGAQLQNFAGVPNLRASDKLTTVEAELRETELGFEEARKKAKRAKATFESIKRRRYERFMTCFNSLADSIDPLYKSLSRNSGAQASLLPSNMEEPYLDEVQFQCVAPGKRFQQMDSLSGGEKTLASLALLFAMHKYNPAPFFFLDEVDAALDNTNIGKVASFIKEYASTQCQVIVISLKEEFYGRSDALIGICPDNDNSCLVSRVFTLDLSAYPDTMQEPLVHGQPPQQQQQQATPSKV